MTTVMALPGKKVRLLFVSANPDDTDRVALDEEARLIRDRLRASAHRDAIEFETRWAARPDDLLQSLNELRPEIVHFAGHGVGGGIVLRGNDACSQAVDSKALKALFEAFTDDVRLVVLNSCYSKAQAGALRQVVDCAVGMSGEVDDEAARVFAGAFYRALGFACSVANAMQQGMAAVEVEGLRAGARPQIKVRKGLNAKDIYLVEPSAGAGRRLMPNTGSPAPQLPGRRQREPGRSRGDGGVARRPVSGTPVVAAGSKKRSYTFDVVSLDARGQETGREAATATGYVEFLGDTALEMVWVPGGEFLMGSDPLEPGRWETEGPTRTVAVEPLAVGRYPITQAQWGFVASLPKVKVLLNSAPARFAGSQRPVEWVSWREACEFCERLTALTGRHYRLPSEAEWEYLARAGTRTSFHFGDGVTSAWVNHDAGSRAGSVDVATYRGETIVVGGLPHAGEGEAGRVANRFGLCDVHGNVGEWCLDVWHDGYAGAPDSGRAWLDGGDATQRVARGGSWLASARNCRSASRERAAQDQGQRHVGFRVVCTVNRPV